MQIKDSAFTGKLYHQFEQQDDGFGNRVFEKADSGLVFESFQMLDMECAPALIIIASNAAHHGNVVFRSMYCKLLFDVLWNWMFLGLSIFQHAYSTWRSLNGLRGWTGFHLHGSRITMMHWHLIGLLKVWKVSNTATRSMSTSACHWSSKTGTREQPELKQWMCPGKELSVATLSSIWWLHWLIVLSWTNLHVHTVNFIAYWVILVILCSICTYSDILYMLSNIT